MTAPVQPPSEPATRRSESSCASSAAMRCRCGAHWFGLKTCHCAKCHRTFTTIGAFDKHRQGSHANDTRHCVDPETVGLKDAGRAYPCWGIPDSGRPRR